MKYFASALVGFAVLVGALAAAQDIKSARPTVGLLQPAKALTPEEIPGYLQDISVTIHASGAQGSGVVIIRDKVDYVLTAGHVVADLRHTRPVIDPKTGGGRIKIEFDDAKVVKEIYDDDGRSVGRLVMDAEVIRYSDSENGEDLALLRLRKKDYFKVGATFCCDSKPLPVGTELMHVGSLLGQMGSNSLTTGVISQQGRVLHGIVYDQSTCAAFPGSSGGGLYRKSDGKYVGMIVRGAGETFNLYVPIRRIVTWADRVGVKFIIDPSVAVPTPDDLKKVPVEEVGGESPASSSAGKPHAVDNVLEDVPFLIKRDRNFQKGKSKITIEW